MLVCMKQAMPSTPSNHVLHALRHRKLAFWAGIVAHPFHAGRGGLVAVSAEAADEVNTH